MNRYPIAARTLAAALLLAALWPLGSSAGDAGQTSAALPASGPAQAAGLPSAPAAAALPASFQGRWTPISSALEAAGSITLNARALRWSICGKAERPIKPRLTNGGQQTNFPAFNASSAPQVTDGGPQVLIDLTADGAPPCKLDGQPVTHLRLKHGSLTSPGDVCEMEATLYGGNGSQPAQPELLAWGTFTNERCPAAQAP